MTEIPVFTETELELMPKEMLIRFFMKIQQLNLVQEDTLSSARRLVKVQQDILELAGLSK